MSIITWNPSDKSNNIILSDNNMTTTNSSWTTHGYVRATKGKTKGKWYWETTITVGSIGGGLGIINKQQVLTDKLALGLIYYYNGNKYNLSTSSKYGESWIVGDIIGVLLDMDNGTIGFYRNGKFQGIAFDNVFELGKEVYPVVGRSGDGTGALSTTTNFGNMKFDMCSSNSNEWNKLLKMGYLPYDIDNSDDWFIKSLINYNNNIISIKDGVMCHLSKYDINNKNFHVNNKFPLSLVSSEINKINYEIKYDRKIEEYSMYKQLLDRTIIEKLKINNNWLYRYFISKYGVSWFKLNESSGNIIDSKGSYTGTPYNLRYDGEDGIYFNGTNSYIQFNGKIIPVGKKSIYFEVRRKGTPGEIDSTKYDFILDNEIQNNRNGICVSINPNGNLQVGWFKNNSTVGIEYYVISTDNICDDKWHKVLYVQDENMNRYLYIDDMITPNAINNKVFDEPEGNANLSIGAYGTIKTQTSSWFNGNIRNVKIYNDAIKFPKELSLIKSNNKYYTFNKETNSLEYINIINPTKSDFETYGINNVIIDKEALNILESNEFEVISLVEDIEAYDSNKIIEVETEPFKPIELLNKEDEFEVLVFSNMRNEINMKLSTTKIDIEGLTVYRNIINNQIIKLNYFTFEKI